MNKISKDGGGHANSAKEIDFGEPFEYKHLGSMATVGRFKALVDLRQSKVIFCFSFFTLEVLIWMTCEASLNSFIGGKRDISSRIRQLVYMAFSISNTSCQLEEQILCGY